MPTLLHTACPRCNEGMREVEIMAGWYSGHRLVITDSEALEHAAKKTGLRFLHPDVPPPSEWCDGSGKGGAE